MEQKQTAVEWLIEKIKLKYDIDFYHIKKEINQAKEMHKEQTLEFVYDAVRKILDEDRQNPFNLEQYYNETFGGNK